MQVSNVMLIIVLSYIFSLLRIALYICKKMKYTPGMLMNLHNWELCEKYITILTPML